MMKDCMEAQGARWRDRSPERGRGLSSETDMGREGGRQADRQTERERPHREEGGRRSEALRLSLISGMEKEKKKKEELAPSASVCAFTPQR